jgi:hypothetical protein
MDLLRNCPLCSTGLSRRTSPSVLPGLQAPTPSLTRGPAIYSSCAIAIQTRRRGDARLVLTGFRSSARIMHLSAGRRQHQRAPRHRQGTGMLTSVHERAARGWLRDPELLEQRKPTRRQRPVRDRQVRDDGRDHLMSVASTDREGSRWAVLALLSVVQLMVVLDATIVTIAIPSAQKALPRSHCRNEMARAPVGCASVRGCHPKPATFTLGVRTRPPQQTPDGGVVAGRSS